MEFFGKEADGTVTTKGEIRTNGPDSTPGQRVVPYDKNSTVCGDCIVVEEEVEKEAIPPVDRLVIPSDITKIKEDDESIYIVGTREGKVTKIRGLDNMRMLKVGQSIFFL